MVAIIAVLVSIAIPIFRNKAEKAKEAYDIYTMRQAASAAVELFYSIDNESSASAAGFSWDRTNGTENAYGVYDPGSGEFYKSRPDYKSKGGKPYGKGTKINAGTKYVMGNDRGAYKADADYTEAVVMVSIYTTSNPPYAIAYWKTLSTGKYIGDSTGNNNPKYCIKIYLD